MLIANFIVKCENNNIHALSIRFIKVLTEPAISNEYNLASAISLTLGSNPNVWVFWDSL